MNRRPNTKLLLSVRYGAGDARARALLHAQNRVAGLIIGSAALTGGYPSMGLDDEEGATLVRRLGKLMLDGAVDEDATAFQLDQKDAEISRLNVSLPTAPLRSVIKDWW